MTQTNASPTGAETPRNVAVTATKPDELPLAQMALIGIAGMPDDMTALFRLPHGKIRATKEGEQIEIGLIIEIDKSGVVVQRRNGNSFFIPPLPIG